MQSQCNHNNVRSFGIPHIAVLFPPTDVRVITGIKVGCTRFSGLRRIVCIDPPARNPRTAPLKTALTLRQGSLLSLLITQELTTVLIWAQCPAYDLKHPRHMATNSVTVDPGRSVIVQGIVVVSKDPVAVERRRRFVEHAAFAPECNVAVRLGLHHLRERKGECVDLLVMLAGGERQQLALESAATGLRSEDTRAWPPRLPCNPRPAPLCCLWP